MKVVQYVLKKEPAVKRLGFLVDHCIIDAQTIRKDLPNNLLEALKFHFAALEEIEKMDLGSISNRFKMEEVQLLPPITSPDKVVCVGMNYKDHCEEQNCPVPTEPIFFSKFSSTLAGPYDDIHYPSVTSELDFEVELALVIGKTGKNIALKDAMQYVFGYTVAHDVSARDWQLRKNGGQWLLGKTMDNFSPIGPAIVTKKEVQDPHQLDIMCRVNGVTEQKSNTNQIVHRIDKLVSFFSQFCTLYPGDIILTGTPPGVGVFRKPPFFLKKGDVVECEIEKLGLIKNKIV